MPRRPALKALAQHLFDPERCNGEGGTLRSALRLLEKIKDEEQVGGSNGRGAGRGPGRGAGRGAGRGRGKGGSKGKPKDTPTGKRKLEVTDRALAPHASPLLPPRAPKVAPRPPPAVSPRVASSLLNTGTAPRPRQDSEVDTGGQAAMEAVTVSADEGVGAACARLLELLESREASVQRAEDGDAREDESDDERREIDRQLAALLRRRRGCTARDAVAIEAAPAPAPAARVGI